jgi:hypothetical protein
VVLVIEPVFADGEKRIPLRECSLDQCNQLLNRLYEKSAAASRLGMDVAQLNMMIDSVESRIDMFESGLIEKPEPKKKSGFGSLKI